MRLGHHLQYWGMRLGSALIRWIPLSWVQGLATGIARALFALGGKRVRWTLANLRIAFPELSEAEREEIGRQSFVNFALALLDVLFMDRWTEEELLEHVCILGREHLDAALARGKGAILLGLHIGSFELGGPAAPALAGTPVAWVSRPIKNPLVDRRFTDMMTRTGCTLIEPRDAAMRMLRLLRNGGVVGLLNDQYARQTRGIPVPFFGVRCSTSPGVAILSLRSGAPVLPTYMTRLGPDRHTATVGPPIEFESTGDRKRDIELATTAVNRTYEAIIRSNPAQYLWLTRRFRKSPDLPASPY